MRHAILPPPDGLQLLLRICRHCGRWFALRAVEDKTDATGERSHVYQCRHCGKETVDPGQGRYRIL